MAVKYINTEIRKEILSKVRKREEDMFYEERCERAGICPECGANKLEHTNNKYPSMIQDQCKPCAMSHLM